MFETTNQYIYIYVYDSSYYVTEQHDIHTIYTSIRIHSVELLCYTHKYIYDYLCILIHTYKHLATYAI